MKRSLLFLIFGAIGSGWVLLGSSFVREKPKKSASAAQLKEDCCREFAQQMKILPRLLRLIADAQELGIEHSQAILEGTKESFFGQSDKAALERCLTKLQAFSGVLEHMCLELEKQASFLSKLEQKSKI